MATLLSTTTIGSLTPITSGNISTQSVTYATSAGSSTTANSATTAGSLTGDWTSMPAGTRVMFHQTAAPTGWTKDTTNYNEHALRVVTGTASSGGSVNFTTAFASQGVSGSVAGTGASGIAGTADAMTLSEAQMPSHNHSYDSAYGGSNSNYNGIMTDFPRPAKTVGILYTGGSSSHSHSVSGGSHSHTSGAFTGTAINMAVKYVDIIIAQKS